jgi:hypothetical protein
MPAGANVIGIDKYVLKHFQRELMSNRMISILCQFKGSFAGMIDFYPEGQAPPSSCHTTLAGQTIFHLNYEIDRYPEIIETFRCENPLYVYVAWDSNTVVTAFVTTSDEPIGEQEGPGVPA